MSDCISRQAAIDALAKFVPYAICDESTESYTNGLTDAYNLILQLPSAQPDRKKGKWKKAYLPHEYMGCRPTAYYCSECNQITTFRTFYCPNCGADMRGDADETD